MDWLMNNPLADMYGPLFLVLYAGLIALTVVTCRRLTGRLDWTSRMSSPSIPSNPDPHLIAYLRGGANEVARSVIFSLVQKGVLQTTQNGTIERVWEKSPVQLSPLEREAYDWFTIPHKTSDIYRSDGLVQQIRRFCDSYEQHLQQEKLLTTSDMRETAALVTASGALALIALGGYKLFVALSEGRFNVLFLLILVVIGVVLVVKLTNLPRISKRGLAYIDRIQLAYSRLKWEATTQPAPQPAATGGADGATFPAYDPNLLLLVGVFGVGALAGTPYGYVQESFHRSATAQNAAYDGSSGCGSSCGSSSDGGSGGGDSGGSSCGSSCGGGCGGGCGG